MLPQTGLAVDENVVPLEVYVAGGRRAEEAAAVEVVSLAVCRRFLQAGVKQDESRVAGLEQGNEL